MQVDINGLRISIAQSFNDLYDTFKELDSNQKEAFQELRQNIAFLLLVYDNSIEMDKLDPGKYLMEIPDE